MTVKFQADETIFITPWCLENKVKRNCHVEHENVLKFQALSEGSQGIITVSSNVNWHKCPSKITPIVSNFFLQNHVK